MNFIQNLVKNTVNNVETLGTKAKAAVNTLSGSASGSPSATSPTEGESGEMSAAAFDETAASVNVGGALVEDVPDESAISTASGEQVEGENGKAAAFINTQEVSQKALDGAKSFGSKSYYFNTIMLMYSFDLMSFLLDFLFSVANKAGQTVSATAKQIKTTVESVVSIN